MVVVEDAAAFYVMCLQSSTEIVRYHEIEIMCLQFQTVKSKVFGECCFVVDNEY